MEGVDIENLGPRDKDSLDMALCCGWPKAKGSIKSKVLENDYDETKIDDDAANPFSYKGRSWNKEKKRFSQF